MKIINAGTDRRMESLLFFIDSSMNAKLIIMFGCTIEKVSGVRYQASGGRTIDRKGLFLFIF